MEERVAERTIVLEQARIALERMALYDALTGLANRTLLGDRIRQASARAERGARPPCVLVLDLDEFKTINDGLGHSAGDRILIEVARRLTSVVRETDTVARLGGDEFAILMPDTTEDDALRVAERALKELHSPFAVGRSSRSGPAPASDCVSGCAGRAPTICCGTPTPRCTRRRPRAAATFRSSGRKCITRRESGCRSPPSWGRPSTKGELGLYYQPIVRAGLRPHHRCRGAGPVGASGAGPAAAGRLHPGRRRQRAHHRTRPLGGAGGDRPAADLDLDSFPAAPFQLHVNLSPVEVRWPGMAEFIREALDRPWGRTRSGWPWRSPKPV